MYFGVVVMLDPLVCSTSFQNISLVVCNIAKSIVVASSVNVKQKLVPSFSNLVDRG